MSVGAVSGSIAAMQQTQQIQQTRPPQSQAQTVDSDGDHDHGAEPTNAPSADPSRGQNINITA